MTYEYERVDTPARGLRLHLNENTAGCSPAVLAALGTLTREQAAAYPDYTGAIAACVAHLGVRDTELLLTNGLDEGILAAAVTALRGSSADSPREAVVVAPAFDMYAACADAAGGRVVEIPLEADFSFPLHAILERIGRRTAIVFLTTPHNPTGQIVSRDAIVTIAREVPHATVFVDEAYIDFGGTTIVGDPAASDLPNIVVGRTFAKAYGLAALRVGALVGHVDRIAALRRVVPPYSLNVCAALALPAALADSRYYGWYCDQVQTSRGMLYAACERLGLRYWVSAANFVLVDLGAGAKETIRALAERGIFVRDRSHDPGCDGFARVTAGVVEHTERFIGTLEEVLCAAR